MGSFKMLDSQFMRIERIAGGINASNRDIVKAVHTRLTSNAKKRENRTGRHAIIIAALNSHNRGR